MDNELFLLAADTVLDVYNGNYEQIKSTEFKVSIQEYHNKPILVLAIGGTGAGGKWDAVKDWFWNLFLKSRDDVKYSAWLSTERISRVCLPPIDLPMLVTGHSKGASTALRYKQVYNPDYCVAFCPARVFRKETSLNNTAIFIDPDDPVPKAGSLLYKQPKCRTYHFSNDSGLFSIKDHFMTKVKKQLLEKAYD